jgi:hypothetical protein
MPLARGVVARPANLGVRLSTRRQATRPTPNAQAATSRRARAPAPPCRKYAAAARNAQGEAHRTISKPPGQPAPLDVPEAMAAQDTAPRTAFVKRKQRSYERARAHVPKRVVAARSLLAATLKPLLLREARKQRWLYTMVVWTAWQRDQLAAKAVEATAEAAACAEVATEAAAEAATKAVVEAEPETEVEKIERLLRQIAENKAVANASKRRFDASQASKRRAVEEPPDEHPAAFQRLGDQAVSLQQGAGGDGGSDDEDKPARKPRRERIPLERERRDGAISRDGAVSRSRSGAGRKGVPTTQPRGPNDTFSLKQIWRDLSLGPFPWNEPWRVDYLRKRCSCCKWPSECDCPYCLDPRPWRNCDRSENDPFWDR